MTATSKRIAQLTTQMNQKGGLRRDEEKELYRLLERQHEEHDYSMRRITIVETKLVPVEIKTTSGSVFSVDSGGHIDLNDNTLELNSNYTFSGSGGTLTMSGNSGLSGSNTGDVTLATNSGLALSSQVLNMGTPSSVTATSTNSVTTSTHTHVADSTLARSAVTLTAGNGLTGGGDLSSNRTFAVGAGTLITVAADDIGITPATSQYKLITSGASPYAAAWSDFSVRGTTGGTTNLAVTNAKTLTLTAADNYNLTLTGSPTLSGSGTLTLTTNLTNNTGAGTLTWPAGGATLTVPTTGTAALGAATLSVTSTNSYSTNSQSHAITTSAAVTGATQVILATDTSGLLQLYGLGIGTAKDAQYDLDVAGSVHTSSYFVGNSALEVEGALMLCHFDGQRPYETDYTGETTGHMGQVGTKAGGAIFRPGVYGKGIQIAEAATTLWTNPSIETNTTGYVGTGATISQSLTYSKYGTYSLKCITNNAGIAEGWYTPQGGAGSIAVSAETSYVMSLYVYGASGSVTPQIRWYKSDDTFISASTGSSYTLTSAAGWQKIVYIATSPALAAKAAMLVRTTTQQSTTFYADEINFIQSTYCKPSLDGSLGDGHTWSGTAHASTSARTAATLYYTNPLLASAGTLSLYWTPCYANTTAQATPYLFSEGNLKAYYQASDDKVYFTDGTNTISTSALTFTADANQLLAFSWSSAGLAIRRYYNSTMDTTVTGATYTAPALGTNLYIGSDTSGTNQCNSVIDELAILNRVITDAEFLAWAEKGAPLFAETSTWQWRAGAQGGVYADIEGLWVKDTDGNAVFGVYRGTATKSWGGKTLSPGDVLIGLEAASKSWLFFDQSTADLTMGVNTTTTFQLDGSTGDLFLGDIGASKFNLMWDASEGDLLLRSNTTAYFQVDGSASLLKFGSDVNAAGTTAIAIFGAEQSYNSETVYAGDLLIGDNTASKANIFWDNSAGKLYFRGGTTNQVYIDTTGALMWDGGNGILDSSGIKCLVPTSWAGSEPALGEGYTFYDANNSAFIGGLFGKYDNGTNSFVYLRSTTAGGGYARTVIHTHDGTDTTYIQLDASNPSGSTIAIIANDGITLGPGPVNIDSNSTTALLVEQNTVKDNVLIADTTNGRVGINCAPSQAFEVTGASKITGATTIVGNTGITGTLSANVNSTTALLVEQDGVHDNVLVADTTNGRIGVNDGSPAEALDVTGNINATGVIKIDDVQVVSSQYLSPYAENTPDAAWTTGEANLLTAIRDCLLAHGLMALEV